MGKTKRVYEWVAEGKHSVTNADAFRMLCRLAVDCDELRDGVISCAKAAAELFTSVAMSHEEGHTSSSNPCASSVVYDLPVKTARLAAKEEAFWDLVVREFGVDECKRMRAEVRAGYAVTHLGSDA